MQKEFIYIFFGIITLISVPLFPQVIKKDNRTLKGNPVNPESKFFTQLDKNYRMPEFIPDKNIDFKILEFVPDSTIDYKILESNPFNFDVPKSGRYSPELFKRKLEKKYKK